ncbi:putative phosphate phosphoenolpyruvate translocator protein [Grosmannia clavigera kw1407]|uniref:Putative phosphate phosphoenolpyruvate translocator protein n=1 Tax=Grosmannia clavigera (strain kw1407 / UAMH 11150) TaxID=655863 RepID=F0XJE1_GROCL|nr:putative phosphate phosphoenolpyruvate translocator protein [Grosmannia clavigera kw1407]EFX02132.1 putative phosphate phosphoenolpyruvate translocator protein [Grosmannia clavigera kw1407]
MARPMDLEAQRSDLNGGGHESLNDESREKLFEKDGQDEQNSSSSSSSSSSGLSTSSSASSTLDAAEYTASATSKWAYLASYFACNVALTLYNKGILGRFAYPWLLTAIHTGSASIGCYILRMRGKVTRTALSRQQESVLLGFSVLFTINIAISNVSLAMVSIPFHQIMRSTCPVFTVLIYRLRYGRTYGTRTYLSLVPVVLGVALATYGDYYFTATGFLLTFLGVLLASAKTVATNRIMTGPLALSPLESLMRMSPLACIQALLCSVLSGEISRITDGYTVVPINSHMFWALAGNGALAFALNLASFSTNRKTGALTMTVCGNVKQSLTVLLGITMFGVKVGVANGIGMFVALVGAAWYSVVELGAKAPARR